MPPPPPCDAIKTKLKRLCLPGCVATQVKRGPFLTSSLQWKKKSDGVNRISSVCFWGRKKKPKGEEWESLCLSFLRHFLSPFSLLPSRSVIPLYIVRNALQQRGRASPGTGTRSGTRPGCTSSGSETFRGPRPRPRPWRECCVFGACACMCNRERDWCVWCSPKWSGIKRPRLHTSWWRSSDKANRVTRFVLTAFSDSPEPKKLFFFLFLKKNRFREFVVYVNHQ